MASDTEQSTKVTEPVDNKDAVSEDSGSQQKDDPSIARGLLLNYGAVKGTFPAIATADELTLTKIASMQSPALLTQNLVGKANFDSPALSPKKEGEAEGGAGEKEKKKRTKRVGRSVTLRGQPSMVMRQTDEDGGKSPLALAHLATSSDLEGKEVKTKYNKDAIIDVMNFNHREKKKFFSDESSFFTRAAKTITRSRKSKIDLTRDNSQKAQSALADSNHVTTLKHTGGEFVPAKQAKPPKQGAVKLTSYTLCMEDRLLRQEDPQFYFDNYVGDRNVIDVRWYNTLQSKSSRKKGHTRTRSNSH